MRNGAFVLTIEIGFGIHVNEHVGTKEKQRSEEFVFVEKSGIETQIAQDVTTKSVGTSCCPKVALLEEGSTRPSPFLGTHLRSWDVGW